MIDLHMLQEPETLTSEQEAWYNDSLNSIPEFCTLQRSQSIKNGLLTARLQGFSKGENRIVSFLDWDDMLTNCDSIKQLAEDFLLSTDVVWFTNSEVIKDDKTVRLTFSSSHTVNHFIMKTRYVRVHQLVLIKRAAFLEAKKIFEHIGTAPFEAYGEQGIYLVLSYLGTITFKNVVCYKWRHHSGNSFSTQEDKQKGPAAKQVLIRELDSLFTKV